MLGLRSRVVLTFGLLSLTVALLVSLSTYFFARSYLLSQRESAGITRALLDARSVWAALDNGADPGDAVAEVPAVGGAQALVRVDGTWYARGVSLSPDDVPAELMDLAAASGAAYQRFAAGEAPLLGIAVARGDDLYLELAPLAELDDALRSAGWFVAVVSLLSLGLGAALGAWAATRLLRPVRGLSTGASRIAAGDLSARLEPTSDPDLEPLTDAFNEMADAVEQRIARERRFVANVSHELRSPLTAVLGTAELLDNHRGSLPPRDAELVSGLVAGARRLSRTLVDLLEISGGTDGHPVQAEAVDVSLIAAALLAERGLPESTLLGDRPIVRTDARRVERVLANLVDNADRHGGGVCAIVLEQTPLDLRIHVDDAGPGVPQESARQLFEPFARGRAPGAAEGAGLGLAIALESARAVGGDIVVGRSPQGGARFTLVLPPGGGS